MTDQVNEAVAWVYEELAGVDGVWVERVTLGPLPPWETRNARPLYTHPARGVVDDAGHVGTLQAMFAVCANERRMMEADALDAAIQSLQAAALPAVPDGMARDLGIKADHAYVDYINQMRRPECLGWDHKVRTGKFTETELRAHMKAGELLGRHRALSEVAAMLARQLSASEAMLAYSEEANANLKTMCAAAEARAEQAESQLAAATRRLGEVERIKRDIEELYDVMPMLPITAETMDAATDWFTRYCIDLYREISAVQEAALTKEPTK